MRKAADRDPEFALPIPARSHGDGDVQSINDDPHLSAAPAVAARGRLRARPRVRTWVLMAPAVGLLAIWMIVPLGLTIWYSLQGYNLLYPPQGFVGLDNYEYLLTDPGLPVVIWNTIVLVVAACVVTIILGTLIAVLFDQPFYGRAIARLLVVAPFLVMPTVSALVWKDLLMHPVYGLFAWISRWLGLTPIDWFADYPMVAIIIIVAWEWTPFVALILLTSLQSLDRDLVEAARMDGAGPIANFAFITLPHLARPIVIVVMLETIFFLAIYAEILVTTIGGPGLATTNLPFFIYSRALLAFDVGGASAGGILAIVLATVVTFFFVRAVARQL
jgi:sorbitol/mannitol transport system permease protein